MRIPRYEDIALVTIPAGAVTSNVHQMFENNRLANKGSFYNY